MIVFILNINIISAIDDDQISGLPNSETNESTTSYVFKTIVIKMMRAALLGNRCEHRHDDQ